MDMQKALGIVEFVFVIFFVHFFRRFYGRSHEVHTVLFIGLTLIGIKVIIISIIYCGTNIRVCSLVRCLPAQKSI